MPLHIRPLVADDRVVWGQMWRDYLSFYDTAIAPEIYETTFARLINPTNRVQNARVAELDGAAVGIVHYIYHAHNWHRRCMLFTRSLCQRFGPWAGYWPRFDRGRLRCGRCQWHAKRILDDPRFQRNRAYAL